MFSFSKHKKTPSRNMAPPALPRIQTTYQPGPQAPAGLRPSSRYPPEGYDVSPLTPVVSSRPPSTRGPRRYVDPTDVSPLSTPGGPRHSLPGYESPRSHRSSYSSVFGQSPGDSLGDTARSDSLRPATFSFTAEPASFEDPSPTTRWLERGDPNLVVPGITPEQQARDHREYLLSESYRSAQASSRHQGMGSSTTMSTSGISGHSGQGSGYSVGPASTSTTMGSADLYGIQPIRRQNAVHGRKTGGGRRR